MRSEALLAKRAKLMSRLLCNLLDPIEPISASRSLYSLKRAALYYMGMIFTSLMLNLRNLRGVQISDYYYYSTFFSLKEVSSSCHIQSFNVYTFWRKCRGHNYTRIKKIRRASLDELLFHYFFGNCCHAWNPPRGQDWVISWEDSKAGTRPISWWHLWNSLRACKVSNFNLSLLSRSLFQ